MTMRQAAATFLLGAMLAGCASAVPTLTLTGRPPGAPPGNPEADGVPGQTVGWDYSIVNDTTDFLVITNSFFCEPGQDPQFTTCTQAIGTYQDYIAANGTIVPPLMTSSQMFSPGNPGTGVGGYTITSPGSDGDHIFVVFNECADLSGTMCSGDMFMNAPATVNPEPSTLVLAAAGLLVVGWRWRKLRKS